MPGKVVPVEVPGTEQVRPAQLALLAMGFLGPEQALLNELASSAMRAATCARSTASMPRTEGRICRRDCRRGQSLVVLAINEGRGAARECDRYLMGKTDLP